MSYVEIELENIGIFRGKREFRLSRGLNVIHAPNASGKTSLLAGLKAVAISSLTPRELARILNDYEERGKVKLVLDGAEYTVELVRRSDGNVEAWGKRLAENGTIKNVAFIDLENDLVNAIYTGDSEHVKVILQELTGVSFIRTTIEVLSGLLSEARYKYETEKRAYEAKKEEIERRVKELEERLRKVRQRIDEIRSDPTLEPARKEVEKIESEREKYDEELRKIEGEMLEKRNEYGLLDTELKKLEAELEVYLNKRKELEEERRKLEENIKEIRKKIEILIEEVINLKNQIKNINEEIRDKRTQIERRKQVLGYAQCPYCGAPINEEKLRKEIAELEEEIYKLIDEREKLEKTVNNYEREISDLRERGEVRLEGIRREIRNIDNRIDELKRKHDIIKKTIRQISKLLKELEERKKELRLQIDVLIRSLEKFKDKIPLVDELKKLWEEEGRLNSDIITERARLRQIEELYKEVRELGETIKTLELLKSYFEIRLSELKSAVVNKVNEAILKHFKLLSLSELEYPVLAEDFSLTLTRKGGTPTTLAELSDAEKAIFAILMTLALKDYIADDFPFYAVDTLIEFIDETRAREILKYLMEVAKDKIVIATKTKPYTGQSRLLSQEDILVNTIP